MLEPCQMCSCSTSQSVSVLTWNPDNTYCRTPFFPLSLVWWDSQSIWKAQTFLRSMTNALYMCMLYDSHKRTVKSDTWSIWKREDTHSSQVESRGEEGASEARHWERVWMRKPQSQPQVPGGAWMLVLPAFQEQSLTPVEEFTRTPPSTPLLTTYRKQRCGKVG